MGKLTNLLKWKKTVIIKTKDGAVAKDEDGNPVVVYMRVIGDHDLEDASRKARLESALIRARLFDPTSEDHIINLSILDQATEDECRQLIEQGRATNWSAEAYSVVEVPELPKIDEIAKDPDAPSLEELEKMDKETERVNAEYQAALRDYVETRRKELAAQIENKPLEDLRSEAKDAMVILLAVDKYITTLRDEKVWRSVYQDEKHTLPEFKDKDEYMNLDAHIKLQLQDEYESLEAGLNDVKN
jgi:small-conductance mechanosensitive channel